ncbi:MAG TPA: GntR family transcriptional regulator [Thermoanaerobaculia bacterium]|jgi:DNA-binding GntR family transcriptional regulator|nr:GntR family transcriptional regulator [Thermoanaerobaculia bacterium]
MQSAAPLALVRDNISDTLVVELRNRIVDGRLPPGERINEVHLAQEIGVSRTPLREALARLAHEGALRAVPRIGWSVRPLTLEEFEQLYPLRALLDPEALRLAGIPSRERLDHLRDLNEQLGRTRDADEAIALDDAWHLDLLSDCPNQVLLGLIEQFMHRTRRYELALMREQKNVSTAAASHKAILSALHRRNLKGACAGLRLNLQQGSAPIVAWLQAREKETR